MKKLISLLLVLMLTLMTLTPAASALDSEVYEKRPIIYIRGNGDPIYTKDGRPLPAGLDAIFERGDDESISKEALIESTANILLPFLAEGMLMDQWDNYGDAIYEEFAPLFDEMTLDENGNPRYDTVVSPEAMWDSYYRAGIDFGEDGYFNNLDYKFCYDYRLSPYDHTERLHEYVLQVMETTGATEVCLSAKCMGGSLLNAYLAEYGNLGHIKKVFYGDVLSNGHSFISDAFSGKITFNDEYTQLYVKQLEYCGETGEGNGIVISQLASDIVNRTIDLFSQTGMIELTFGSVENLYAKLYKALVPALILATGIATMPNYWVSVYEEDMDTALNLIFGEEGSEKRTKYAGLISKIQRYRENISADLPAFYEKISKEYKIEVGVLARYGFVNMPFLEHYDELNDGLVGLQDSSLGATCSTATTTLSDEYIANRVAENPDNAKYISPDNAKYISPDKMVDTSTCFFPETTWIIKNSHHDDKPQIFNYLAEYFLGYTNVKVNTNNKGISQFLVEDKSATDTGYVVNMTEENCAGFDWMESTYVEKPTIQSRLASLFKWLTSIFTLIAKFFKGELNIGK